jgi:hypothetical protein
MHAQGTNIFGSDILEVSIGIVFVLVSTICSAGYQSTNSTKKPLIG